MFDLVFAFTLFACKNLDEKTTESSDSTSEKEGSNLNSDIPVRGYWANEVFINEYIGIKLELSDGWIYAPDEILAGIYDKEIGFLSKPKEKYNSEMLSVPQITEAHLRNDEKGSSIIVVLRKLNDAEETEAEFLDKIKTEVEQNNPEHFELTYSDYKPVDICGNAYVSTECKVTQTELNESIYRYYYVKKVGNYMQYIYIQLGAEDNINDVMNGFIK